MTALMFDCLIAGDACVDLLVEGVSKLEIGKEKEATGMSLVLGGSSSITAFNLSSLGAKVLFAGVLGTDLFGRFVEARLTEAGVDLETLRWDTREKTGVTIWHSDRGERAGVTYMGTISMLRPRDLSDEVLKRARHLHVGSYFLLDKLHAGAAGVFARAKKLGLTTSLDCNYDPSERWDSNILKVLKHVDVFLPNEQEARQITGERSVVQAGRKLATCAKTVIVKQGAKGAAVFHEGRSFVAPARKVARVVDTTGAGDSFNAGFLSRFTKGYELEECVTAAIQAAARSVQKRGGTAAFEAKS